MGIGVGTSSSVSPIGELAQGEFFPLRRHEKFPRKKGFSQCRTQSTDSLNGALELCLCSAYCIPILAAMLYVLLFIMFELFYNTWMVECTAMKVRTVMPLDQSVAFYTSLPNPDFLKVASEVTGISVCVSLTHDLIRICIYFKHNPWRLSFRRAPSLCLPAKTSVHTRVCTYAYA